MSHVCGCNTGDAQTGRRRLAEIAASESPRFQREDRTDRCQREKREGRRQSRSDRVKEIKRKLDAAKRQNQREGQQRERQDRRLEGIKNQAQRYQNMVLLPVLDHSSELRLRLPFDPESSLPDWSPDAARTVRPTGRAEQRQSLPTRESVTIGSASEGQ